MHQSNEGRVWARAVAEASFRRRLLMDMGAALAEEGFILSDAEMTILRRQYESLHGLNDRAAYERMVALAHGYRRE